MIRVAIIEDENISSKHLVDHLNQYSQDAFSIEKIIDSIKGTIKWFIENDLPDLIFMDIHLSDGNCFELFKRINIDCPIIFTTAYDEYAIKAFKANSIDYLLKPITERDFKFAIEKFMKLHQTNNHQILNKGHLQLQESLNKSRERFLIKLGNKYIPIKVEDIAYFYMDEIVYAKLFSGKSLPMNSSLVRIEQELPEDVFFRVNRKIIVNINAIQHLEIYKPGQLTMRIHPVFSDRIVLSQERSSALKGLLN